MYVAITSLVLILLVFYWIRMRAWADTARSPTVPILLIAMLALLAYTGGSGEGAQSPDAPALVFCFPICHGLSFSFHNNQAKHNRSRIALVTWNSWKTINSLKGYWIYMRSTTRSMVKKIII